jgi:hypothetical protein
MAKVLMFSRDPGGANVIVPLVSPMRARGHEVVLLGKDMALARYRHAGLEGTSITDRMAQVTQESIMGLLRSEGPDAVVTGTSADDF